MPVYRLKTRHRPLPGGIGYSDPRTRYQAAPFTSFDQTCQEVLASRIGNPAFTKRYSLSTDINVIQEEVETYLAKVAHDHRWADFYITADANMAPPIPADPAIKKNITAPAVLVAAKTILDMMGAEGPVDQELAEKRAAVCVECPKHEKGTWESLFTIPVARVVRGMIGTIHGAKLRTTQDDNLRTCGVCKCPNLTKIWARLDHIKAHIPSEDFEQLPPSVEHPDFKCWIKSESEPCEHAGS